MERYMDLHVHTCYSDGVHSPSEVVAMAAAIVVWWPVLVTFNLNAEMLVNDWAERDPPMTDAEMHRWLAYYTGRHARANQVRIERRLLWFAAGLIGLALETGGLIAMLVAKR